MSLDKIPQLTPVNLVRRDGSPALTGHYMVDFLSLSDSSETAECFVSSGQQNIPLSGCRELKPGDILGTASSPLLRVPLETLAIQDTPKDCPAPQPDTAPIVLSTDFPDEPPADHISRLDGRQRESFLRLWDAVPPHIRRVNFALDATGWDPTAIDALSSTLTEFADVFSSSKLDYGECSLRPFEIKVPPGTQPIQSRPYRLSPALLNKSTPFSTPTLQLVSSSISLPLGQAPWYAYQKIRRHPYHS